MPEFKKSVLNRGQRIYSLSDGRVLNPGQSIECKDEKEYNFLVDYKDIIDIDKVAPHIIDDAKKIRLEIEKLKKEKSLLLKQVSEFENKLNETKLAIKPPKSE